MLTSMTVDQLETMPKVRLVDIARATDFIKHPISTKLNKTFRIGVRVFDTVLEAETITAQQFILLNKYTGSEAETTENLHYILAVLTNERKGIFGRKYPFDFDFENKAQLFKDKLSIDHAFAPSVFFCKIYESWLDVTQTSLLKQAKEVERKAKKILEKMKV